MQYTPETTIITFDLHGVVVGSNYLKILKILLSNPVCVLKLAIYSFNPFFLKNVYQLWRSHAVATAYLELVKNKYPFLKKTIPFFIAIGNAQKPNVPLIEFIKKLKKNSYCVHLFSNIGDIVLDDFISKYPDIVELFDMICSTHKANGYIGKPYDTAFIAYQTTCNPIGKHVIFIDNTKHNISAANRHAMIGIYYTTADQLILDLSTMLTF